MDATEIYPSTSPTFPTTGGSLRDKDRRKAMSELTCCMYCGQYIYNSEDESVGDDAHYTCLIDHLKEEVSRLQQQDRRMKWLKCNGYGFLKYPDGTYRILKAQGNGFVGVEKPTNYRVRYYADLDTAIDKAMEAEK
jgi:hypothetical protein